MSSAPDCSAQPPAPRRRRWVLRLIIYGGLLVALSLLLLPPYVRQLIFGPRVAGQPLWYWQQTYLARHEGVARGGIPEKITGFLGLGPKSRQPGRMPDANEDRVVLFVSLLDHPDP